MTFVATSNGHVAHYWKVDGMVDMWSDAGNEFDVLLDSAIDDYSASRAKVARLRERKLAGEDVAHLISREREHMAWCRGIVDGEVALLSRESLLEALHAARGDGTVLEAALWERAGDVAEELDPDLMDVAVYLWPDAVIGDVILDILDPNGVSSSR